LFEDIDGSDQEEKYTMPSDPASKAPRLLLPMKRAQVRIARVFQLDGLFTK
jgi:uncharacterized protein VirK/YbjX